MSKVVSGALLILILAHSALGQAGRIRIYSDAGGGDCNLFDLAPGTVSYYIVHDGSAGATESRFWAPIPTCMEGVVHLSDTPVFPLTTGDSQTGVAVSYGQCLATPVHILTITVSAQGKTPNCCCYHISPHPNASSGKIEVVDCDATVLFADRAFGVVNPDPSCDCGYEPPFVNCINGPVPATESTWGRVKALYGPR